MIMSFVINKYSLINQSIMQRYLFYFSIQKNNSLCVFVPSLRGIYEFTKVKLMKTYDDCLIKQIIISYIHYVQVRSGARVKRVLGHGGAKHNSDGPISPTKISINKYSNLPKIFVQTFSHIYQPIRVSTH